MRYVNLTERTVRLRIGPAAVLTLLPADEPAEVRFGSTLKAPPLGGLPVRYARSLVVEGLPRRRKGTVYIAEPTVALVASLSGRWDVFSVDNPAGAPVSQGLMAWDATPCASPR